MKDKAPPVAEALQDAANFFISIDYPGGRGPGHLIEMARCCCRHPTLRLADEFRNRGLFSAIQHQHIQSEVIRLMWLPAGRCNGISGD